jgi:heme-degrading monooxygenase HmoA
MHAVVVNVTINQEEGTVEGLRNELVPRVSAAPGFVAGYWTRKGDNGLSMTIWESEEAATAARDQVQGATPPGVTVNAAELREVVASA